jgi:hypothetical protein
MYQCSKCGLGVLVVGLESPIRACNCKVKVLRDPVTFWEKVFYIFGKKHYLEKNAPITFNMSSTIQGRSNCSI